MLSSKQLPEPLGRFSCLAKDCGPPPPGSVDMLRMVPSVDLRPALEIHECMSHVMREQGPAALTYAPRGGYGPLREAICEELRGSGVLAQAKGTLVTEGSQQALDILARSLLAPGDTILVEHLTYNHVIALFAIAGAKIISIPSDGQGPRMDVLDAVPGQPKGFYLMPNCHNPVGSSISIDRRRELLAWSARVGVPLIEDDYAYGLDWGATESTPSLRSMSDDVLYVGTFAKNIAPALRVGFIVGPDEAISAMAQLRHAMDLDGSLLLQATMAEFLERDLLRPHLARVNENYAARCEAVCRLLEQRLPSSVHFERPNGGVSLWLRLPPQIDGDRVFVQAWNRGALVAPGSVYGVEPGTVNGLRLIFSGEPVSRLEHGVATLCDALSEVSS